eukprot:370150_1
MLRILMSYSSPSSPSPSHSSHRYKRRHRSRSPRNRDRNRSRGRNRRNPDSSNKNPGSNKLNTDYLIPWLKINGLLNDNKTTNDILNECLCDIFKLFGGTKQTLLLIAKQARYDPDINKLKSMNEIISKQRRKQQKTTSNTNNKDIQLLPDECIGHICSYLDKPNVTSFKTTCRRIGVVCLQEMRKKRVAIININQWLNNTDDHFNFYELNIEQMTQTNSYHATTKYCSLYDTWSQQFNIPEKHQLIFANNQVLRHHKFPKPSCPGRGSDCNCNESGRKIKYYTNHVWLVDYNSKQSIKMNTIPNKSNFFICDKRNVVILENNKGIKYKQLEQSERYTLMILEYFDIINQKTMTVQIMLYRDKHNKNEVCKDIVEYIENGFVTLDNVDNTWYYDMKRILKQMEVAKHYPKLCIYQHKRIFPQGYGRNYGYNNNVYRHNGSHRISQMNLVDSNQLQCNEFEEQLFTFQLNYQHPWFNKTNIFNETKLHCTQNNDTFYKHADDFCRETVNYGIKYKGDISTLKSMIKYHYDLKLPTDIFLNEKTSIDKEELNDVIEGVDRILNVRMNTSSISGILRTKISKTLFKSIIEPKYIELFSNTYRIPWTQQIGFNMKEVYFGIVSYDTESF